MKASKWRSLGVMSVLVCGLWSCGKPVAVVSHSTGTEAQARADIELRLAKTREVRAQITALREAIRPVEGVFRDVGKAVDLRVDERPGSVLAGLLDRLGRVLHEAVNGMVAFHADGSWVLERPGFALIPPGQAPACVTGRVRVSGQKFEGGEQFSVAMASCAQPEVYETLATVVIKVDGSREVSISAATFENIHRESIRLENLDLCTLHLRAAQVSDFKCHPMTLMSGASTVFMDRLEFRTDERGTSGNLHASLSHAERGHVGTLDVVVTPGAPAEVRVCTRSQPCGQ